MKWLAFVLATCSAPGPMAPVTGGSADRVAVAHNARVATPPTDASVATATIATPIHVAGDPAEPIVPQAECAFERVVSCHDGLPTRTALQPSPFEWCARTTPPTKSSLYPNPAAMFSAVETRGARTNHPAACCYVEFTTMLCD